MGVSQAPLFNQPMGSPLHVFHPEKSWGHRCSRLVWPFKSEEWWITSRPVFFAQACNDWDDGGIQPPHHITLVYSGILWSYYVIHCNSICTDADPHKSGAAPPSTIFSQLAFLGVEISRRHGRFLRIVFLGARTQVNCCDLPDVNFVASLQWLLYCEVSIWVCCKPKIEYYLQKKRFHRHDDDSMTSHWIYG